MESLVIISCAGSTRKFSVTRCWNEKVAQLFSKVAQNSGFYLKSYVLILLKSCQILRHFCKKICHKYFLVWSHCARCRWDNASHCVKLFQNEFFFFVESWLDEKNHPPSFLTLRSLENKKFPSTPFC